MRRRRTRSTGHPRQPPNSGGSYQLSPFQPRRDLPDASQENHRVSCAPTSPSRFDGAFRTAHRVHDRPPELRTVFLQELNWDTTCTRPDRSSFFGKQEPLLTAFVASDKREPRALRSFPSLITLIELARRSNYSVEHRLQRQQVSALGGGSTRTVISRAPHGAPVKFPSSLACNAVPEHSLSSAIAFPEGMHIVELIVVIRQAHNEMRPFQLFEVAVRMQLLFNGSSRLRLARQGRLWALVGGHGIAPTEQTRDLLRLHRARPESTRRSCFSEPLFQDRDRGRRNQSSP